MSFALVIEASDRLAVATSATYERGHHIVDPRTHRPASAITSTTIVGPDLTMADAYATAVFVMGPEGLDWIEDRHGYEAYLITRNDLTYWSPGFNAYWPAARSAVGNWTCRTGSGPDGERREPTFSRRSGSSGTIGSHTKSVGVTLRVLVVEHQKRLAASLKRRLEIDGFAVDIALTGDDGLWMAKEHDYDGIVLDITLPDTNGHKICETLRDDGDWTPILMLTAKNGEFDETEALDTGADDFLRKPFSHLVLVAHLRALLRRGATERPMEMSADDLRVDPGQRRCWRHGVEVELTAREFSVLEHLVRNAGSVVSKQDILDRVWNYDFGGDPNIVEVYIRHLRKKIDEPFERQSIQTVRGSGYRLTRDGG